MKRNPESGLQRRASFLESLDATLCFSSLKLTSYELPDRLEDAMINCVLGFSAVLELAFRDEQGMIAAFDNVQFVGGGDFWADGRKQVQRTERIASALHKENGCR